MLRDDAKAKLASCLDPGEEKKNAKKVAEAEARETFAAVADEFLGKPRVEKKADAKLDKAEWLLSMAKADLGNKPIRDVSSTMVLQTLRKLESKGNFETAKRLRSNVGAVFRFAIRVDNGREYISEKPMKWAEKQGVTILHVQPQQNAYIERYSRTVWHEWFDQYIIETIEEAPDHATQWLWTYNNDRPNMGIGGITPAQKRKMAA